VPRRTQVERSELKLAWLDDILPLITDLREITIAADSDEPGQQLRDDIALVLGRARSKFVVHFFHSSACRHIPLFEAQSYDVCGAGLPE